MDVKDYDQNFERNALDQSSINNSTREQLSNARDVRKTHGFPSYGVCVQMLNLGALFQPFEFGENMKIQTPSPHLKIVYIFNCGSS